MANVLTVKKKLPANLSFTPIDSKYFASRWWWRFLFGRLAFCLSIVQESPCFIPCVYVVTEFVVFINHIDEVTENTRLRSFLIGRQHDRHQMLPSRRMFNTSWRILRQFPTEIPTPDAIWSTYFLLSLLTMSSTRSTFASFVDVYGRPLHGSFSTVTRLSWKRLYQSQNRDFLIFTSPCVCCNMVNIFAGDFCSKTQTLISVRCSVADMLNCDAIHTHWGNKQLSLCLQRLWNGEVISEMTPWVVPPTYETEISFMQQFLSTILANSGTLWSCYVHQRP